MRRSVWVRPRAAAPVIVAVAILLASCGAGHPTSAPKTSVPPVTTSAATAPTASSTSETPPPTSGTSSTTTLGLAFTWSVAALSADVEAQMTGVSWRPGCPVSLDALRSVQLAFWGFDGLLHTGRLIVNVDSVTPVVGAFRALFAAEFPIRQMRSVDDFAGDDEASMAADNTSDFNCRLVPGTATWSQHAYGRAVDVNPLENPSVRNGVVDPPSGAPWVDRTRSDQAIIRHGDAAWQAFAAVGWVWGGDWTSLKDYQHFSANGL